MAKKNDRLNFGSVVSRLGEPGVWATWGKNEGTMLAPQARATGVALIVAAIEAETDAALMRFLVQGGTEPKHAEQILANVRELRTRTRLDAIGKSVENTEPSGV